MVERLTLFLLQSFLPLPADRDERAFFFFLRGQINLTVCGFIAFHVLSATLTSLVTGDQREILNARIYVCCGQSRKTELRRLPAKLYSVTGGS